MTETNVVQITLLDAAGYARTINIDYPRNNLTLNEIRNVFQIPIANRWLMGKNDVVVEVQKAQYSQSIKTAIGGGEVTATPSSLNITTGNSATVEISGANPTSAIIVNSNVVATSGSGTFLWRNSEINGQTITVKFTADGSGNMHFEGSATLQIWFGADKIEIPITVNITIMVGP